MTFRLLFTLAVTALTLAADVIVLQDGSSYTGQLQPATKGRTVAFTGSNGVGFTFPMRDLQSLSFTANADVVTLRSGKSYTGHYTSQSPLHFAGSEGISYDFPLKDVASIVFSPASPRNAGEPEKSNAGREAAGAAKVVPQGTEISITTNERIESRNAAGGQLYSATIASDVPDSHGGIAIPNGTSAKLVVTDISSGGAVHTPELVLDLYSVDLNGKVYRTATSNVVEKGRDTVGANRRTAIYGGAGAGLGALLGGVRWRPRCGYRSSRRAGWRRSHAAFYPRETRDGSGRDHDDIPPGSHTRFTALSLTPRAMDLLHLRRILVS